MNSHTCWHETYPKHELSAEGVCRSIVCKHWHGAASGWKRDNGVLERIGETISNVDPRTPLT